MIKKLLTLFFITVSTIASSQYAHQNIDLMSNFNDSNVVPEPVYGIRYQSCWGWVDPTNGREYGIIGSTSGTYIIEVTDPYNLVVRDYVPGRNQGRIWHEYKTYQNYLYIVSDGGGNSLQIADLSYLPDSVHVIYDSTAIFDSGHTLYVDGDKLYVARVSIPNTYSSSMNVYSLANGPVPVLLRQLDQDYPAINHVHDMYVTNDTVYASCEYQGLYVFRYDELNNRFIQLGSLTTYPDQGYNHSSFLDETHTTLYMCDEVPDAMAIKVLDVSDLNNIIVVDTFSSDPGNTPHNPYVLGTELFMANYQDGVQAFDISNPHTPVKNGFFDTHPQNPAGTYPYPPYAGCWAVYTDLPSGHLLASDMQLGLFVLDISQVMNTSSIPFAETRMTLFPNPAHSYFDINFPENPKQSYTIYVYDSSGKKIRQDVAADSSEKFRMNTSELANGVYTVVTISNLTTQVLPLIVAH